MSLPTFDPQARLFSLAAATGQAFAADNRFRLFGEKIYPLLVAERPKLEGCYCADNGRPAIEPVLGLGLSVLQFLEGVPDRQAVELLQYHAGWALALNRPLGEPGFDPSVLSRFRTRLVQHQQAPVAFAAILRGLQEAGLVARQSKQRLDSMYVLGKLERMNTLECVRETLRLAAQELAVSAETFGKPACWPLLWERYVESKLDYRSGEDTWRAKLQQAGEDVLALQQWVQKLPVWIQQGEKVRLLGRVLDEHFERVENGSLAPRRAPVAAALHNPHEPDATYAAKGKGRQKKETVGYKLQVGETVRDERPLEKGEPTRSFLTAVETQPAHASDEAGQQQVEQSEAAMGLDKPPTWYVDGAYVSAEQLAQAAAEGRQIIGPAQPAPKKDGRFSPEDFAVSITERRAVCPAGKENTQCSRLEEEKTGKVSYRFEWSTHCHDCPLREKCLGEGQKHRTLVVGEHHDHLQERRQEQRTEAFEKEMDKRNAVEGTQSELVRGHEARQARYRGLPRVRLQNYLIGAACNAKRWIRRLQWEMKQAAQAVEEGAVFVSSG